MVDVVYVPGRVMVDVVYVPVTGPPLGPGPWCLGASCGDCPSAIYIFRFAGPLVGSPAVYVICCVYVAGLTQASFLLPTLGWCVVDFCCIRMYYLLCFMLFYDMSFCVFVLGGGGRFQSLVVWGVTLLLLRVSPDCLLVWGNSANLAWGMACRTSSVR